MADQTDTIAAQLTSAPVGSWLIQGTASRHSASPDAVLNATADLKTLDLTEHTGVVDYEPAELMLRMRAGTLLADLTATLATEGQRLPFESPYGSRAGTVGGAVSTAQVGPARPWCGAVRDAVLGIRLMSGQGQALNFGGQVMKNVASFDVSRLVTGAWGTLGPVLDVCFRLLALPEESASRCFELNQSKALDWLRQNRNVPWPFAGAAWEDSCLRIRLAGRKTQVQCASDKLGGVPEDEAYWDGLLNQQRPVMRQSCCVADVPPATPAHPDTRLFDWGGGRRWFSAELFAEIATWARQQGGHCRLWPGANLALAGEAGLLQQRLKSAFDPDNHFNPHLILVEKDPAQH